MISIDSFPKSRNHTDRQSKSITFQTSDFPNQTEEDPAASNSANWIAMSWATPRPSTNTIDICFRQAPQEYNFKFYKIELIDANSGEWLELVLDVLKTPADKTVRSQCVQLSNVCPGLFIAYVYADDADCACKRNGVCADTGCTRSQIFDINMLDANACTITTVQPTTKPPSVDFIVRLAAVIVAVITAVLLLCGLAAFLYKKYYSNPNEGPYEYDILPKQIKPDIKAPAPVLLVYARDNDAHREVVCRFAKFLKDDCFCHVRIDEWPVETEEISQTGEVEWFNRRSVDTATVIVIHSEGSFLQHQAWKKNERFELIHSDPLDDLFMYAMRLRQNEHLRKAAIDKRYFHVYFPNSLPNHVVEQFGEKTYQLMKCIDELVLNIHNFNKFDEIGKVSLKIDSHSEARERLETAISDAVEYHKQNMDWFLKRYRRITNCKDQQTILHIDSLIAKTEPDNAFNGSCVVDHSNDIAIRGACTSLESNDSGYNSIPNNCSQQSGVISIKEEEKQRRMSASDSYISYDEKSLSSVISGCSWISPEEDDGNSLKSSEFRSFCQKIDYSDYSESESTKCLRDDVFLSDGE
jgi:hypothetical protein